MTALFDTFEIVNYPEHAVIIAPGEVSEAWLIISGIVRQYDTLSNGSQITLNIYKPGAVLTLGWILHDTPNKHTFVAETAVSVRKIPKETYRTYLQQSPDASFQLLERLSKGFDGLFDRVVSQGQGDARSRVLTELRIQQARFGGRDADGQFLTITVTDLATRSGLARETVSRMLTRLARQQVISRSGSTIRLL